jgi:hypothetical protein
VAVLDVTSVHRVAPRLFVLIGGLVDTKDHFGRDFKTASDSASLKRCDKIKKTHLYILSLRNASQVCTRI